jgi:hypothetical protein
MTVARAEPWLSIEGAAAILAETPSGLRRKLERAKPIRGADGVVEVNLAGLVARKFGKRWKVRLSPEWLGQAQVG